MSDPDFKQRLLKAALHNPANSDIYTVPTLPKSIFHNLFKSISLMTNQVCKLCMTTLMIFI